MKNVIKMCAVISISGIFAYPPTYNLHPQVDIVAHIAISAIIGWELMTEYSPLSSLAWLVSISFIWEVLEHSQVLHFVFEVSFGDTITDVIANLLGFALILGFARIYPKVRTASLNVISMFPGQDTPTNK